MTFLGIRHEPLANDAHDLVILYVTVDKLRHVNDVLDVPVTCEQTKLQGLQEALTLVELALLNRELFTHYYFKLNV